MATTVSVKVNKGQTYGQALTKAGVGDPTRTNYIFEGWNTKADGTGEMRVSLQQVVKSETIFAKWAIILAYTVTFNLAGGTRTGGGQLVQTVNHGDSAAAPTCSRTGYTFEGWSGSYTNVTSDRTITAQWTNNTYTLSFNFDGGSGSPSVKPVAYDEVIGTLPTPTKAGHNFTGWKIGSTTILSSTIWDYTANQTAVAQWEEIVRTNNFISVEYVRLNVRAVATDNVTVDVTVTLYSSFIGDSSNSIISNGSQNGTQFINGGASDWYVQSVSPPQDSTYYYIY